MIHDKENLNSTATPKHLHIPWSDIQKDRMLQAIAWGALTSPIIGGRLGQIFGPRLVVSLALASGGFLNLFFPFTSTKSFWASFVIRVAQGMIMGIVGPANFIIISRWSARNENTSACVLMLSGYSLANIIVNPLAGFLAGGDFLGGWPAVFYLLAGLNLVMGLLWYLLVRDDPRTHPLLTSAELNDITKDSPAESVVSIPVPWSEIFTSLPVYGNLVVTFVYFWLDEFIVNQISSFYRDTLNISYEENGIMTALPWLLAMTLSISSGFLADQIMRKNFMSVTNIRRMFNLIGLGTASLAFFAVSQAGKNTFATVALITLTKGIVAITIAGSFSNHLDLSPTFAGTLAGMNDTVSFVAALAMHETVARIVGDEPTDEHWYRFIWICSGLNLIGYIFSYCVVSGDVQKWDPAWKS